tara:strand:+ start:601 stop:1053 length:453 start_codon:yes stop_codon:yes gene_type:complete
MKNFIWISILFFLAQCGYTAVYKDNTEKRFTINIIEMSGNKQMNNLIKSELKSYSKAEANKIFNLNINSEYEKKINTKDATGKPEEFQLTLITNIDINLEDEKIKALFKESFKMKNSTDMFELKKYEDIIKRNLAKSTKEKLILKLISLE